MIDLIKKLRENDIQISLEKNDLVISFNGEEFDPKLLLELKTNKLRLVEYLKKYINKKEYKDIVRLPVQDSYPISSSQRRLWVLSQFEDGSKAYHIPSHMSLKANASDISNLKLAIHCVIERHEILRTVFRENAEGEVRQW